MNGSPNFTRQRARRKIHYDKETPLDLVPSQNTQVAEENRLKLHVNFSVVSVMVPGARGVSVKYQLALEDSWSLEFGASEGVSPIVNSSSGDSVSLQFQSKFSLSTVWPNAVPKIVFTVFGFDFLGRSVILGYGVTPIFYNLSPFSSKPQSKVPQKNPVVKLTVPIIYPVAKSGLTGLLGWLTNQNPEFIDPVAVMAKGEGREATVTSHRGEVEVSFEVATENFDENRFFS